MAQQLQRVTRTRSSNGIAELPKGRAIMVRAADGTRLHTEIFGPDDGYPVVFSHGVTCALRVWAHQIADLSKDHRVIAFDHRGHGRSESLATATTTALTTWPATCTPSSTRRCARGSGR